MEYYDVDEDIDIEEHYEDKFFDEANCWMDVKEGTETVVPETSMPELSVSKSVWREGVETIALARECAEVPKRA